MVKKENESLWPACTPLEKKHKVPSKTGFKGMSWDHVTKQIKRRNSAHREGEGSNIVENSRLRKKQIAFALKSLVYLDLCFVQGNTYRSICMLIHSHIKVVKYHLLKMISLFFGIIFVSLSKKKNQVSQGGDGTRL